jgi:death-on-curing protein
MRYLTVDELIYINEQLSGTDPIHRILKGRQKVRDLGLLEAAAGTPRQSVFGADAYPTAEEKAAALLFAIARNHPFADGNKRTGTLGALFFLRVNGAHVVWDADAALDRIVAVAEGAVSITQLAPLFTHRPVPPMPTPEADADMAVIARLLSEHAGLLDALAAR